MIPKRHHFVVVGGYVSYIFQVLLEVNKARKRERLPGIAFAVSMPNAEQAPGVWIRKRPQQNRVDHGEDGSVGAHGERQRKNDSHGESRRIFQLP
jgi:hypothetical protein